jgi:hypothetical protein
MDDQLQIQANRCSIRMGYRVDCPGQSGDVTPEADAFHAAREGSRRAEHVIDVGGRTGLGRSMIRSVRSTAPGTVLTFTGEKPRSTAVRLFGTTARVVYRTDEIEHARRREADLGHLDSMELLDILMDLPADSAVPTASVGATSQSLLCCAPEGVVRFAVSSVTRLVRPVVTPLLAVVHARDWHDGLERASRFAAYCPRLVVVRELPPDSEQALAEASFYGIGVAVGARSAPTVVLEPEPFLDWQPSVAWWHFTEQVYRPSLGH